MLLPPVFLLILGIAAIWAAKLIGEFRQGNLESGAFWADVILLSLAGLVLVIAGAIWTLIRTIARLRR